MKWKGCIDLNYYSVGNSKPYMLAVRLPSCAETSQPLYIQAENSKLQTNDCSPLSRLSTEIVTVASQDIWGCPELSRLCSKEQELSRENLNMYTICALRAC